MTLKAATSVLAFKSRSHLCIFKNGNHNTCESVILNLYGVACLSQLFAFAKESFTV